MFYSGHLGTAMPVESSNWWAWLDARDAKQFARTSIQPRTPDFSARVLVPMSITQRSHVWMFRSWTSKQARSLKFALETVGWQNSSSYLNNLPTFLHLVLQSFLHEVKSIIETLSKCNLASLYDPSRETVSVSVFLIVLIGVECNFYNPTALGAYPKQSDRRLAKSGLLIRVLYQASMKPTAS